MFALLAAVLHLCNIEMAVDPESEEVIVMNEDEMDYGRTLFFFCFFFGFFCHCINRVFFEL